MGLSINSFFLFLNSLLFSGREAPLSAPQAQSMPTQKKSPLSGACADFLSAFDEIFGERDDTTDQLFQFLPHALSVLAFFLG